MDSILKTIRKHIVGYEENNPAFDTQLIDEINAALWRLNQLNVGTAGFTITDDTQTWSDFMGADTKNINMVITYVKDVVRLSFDPPTSSFVLSSVQSRIDRTEWLLRAEVDPEYE